jgi:hypothetical protein
MTTATPAELLRSRAVPIPGRMQDLPVCPTRGIPIPWFVARVDGKADFRIADARKRSRAIGEGLCWVCGTRLVPPSSFVLGPMCGLNHITSEPPCHPECALYSVKACPFLTRPRMERREGGIPEKIRGNLDSPGVMIARNPGVAALWVTKGWHLVDDHQGRELLDAGDCHSVTWWAEGRPATRAEVITSIVTGLPHLHLPDDPEAWEFLAQRWVALDALLPREAYAALVAACEAAYSLIGPQAFGTSAEVSRQLADALALTGD